LDQGVAFVLNCVEQMHGGEVFVPKIPSTGMMDLAKAIAPDCEIDHIGIRPGEKLHECLMSEDESRTALDLGDFFVIQPMHKWWVAENWPEGTAVAPGFRYSSDTNDRLLKQDELKGLLDPKVWAAG